MKSALSLWQNFPRLAWFALLSAMFFLNSFVPAFGSFPRFRNLLPMDWWRALRRLALPPFVDDLSPEWRGRFTMTRSN